MDVLVISPTYNERENIKLFLDRLISVFDKEKGFFNVLIVDDNSPDGTGEIVNNYKDDRVKLLRREKKEGLGKAYKDAIKYALENYNVDYLIHMDADLSHDSLLIPVLLSKIKDNDVVIASRYIKGGDVTNWSKSRKVISKAANLYGKFLLSLQVNDISSGFRCYNVEFLKKLNLNEIKSDGYSFLEEMLFLVRKNNGKMMEVPFAFVDRIYGKTKLTRKEMINFFTTILRLFMIRWKN